MLAEMSALPNSLFFLHRKLCLFTPMCKLFFLPLHQDRFVHMDRMISSSKYDFLFFYNITFVCIFCAANSKASRCFHLTTSHWEGFGMLLVFAYHIKPYISMSDFNIQTNILVFTIYIHVLNFFYRYQLLMSK